LGKKTELSNKTKQNYTSAMKPSETLRREKVKPDASKEAE